MDRDEDGDLYLVIHSGSRHLGLEVANFYQNEAYQRLNGSSKADAEALAAQLKAEGRDKEIQKALKALKGTKRTSVPKPLAYAQGELFDDYIHDMAIVQQFAALSRQAMVDELLRGLKLHAQDSFTDRKSTRLNSSH